MAERPVPEGSAGSDQAGRGASRLPRRFVSTLLRRLGALAPGGGGRRAAPRIGLQAEVLLSLIVVMLLATVVLTAVLLTHHEGRLRDLLGRALVAEAYAADPRAHATVPGTAWWVVDPRGGVVGRPQLGQPIDPATLSLAEQVRRGGEPLLRPGAVWESVRFATPLGSTGRVAVARLPREASIRLRAAPLGVATLVLLADLAVFIGFGLVLLRRRVVRPLQNLAEATATLTGGDWSARVPIEGTRETARLARAFNDMAGTLQQRTEALVKAVTDLRETNADLRRARVGLDRAERLASVGRLAAGVSHEVGNPMAALLSFLELVSRDEGLSAVSRDHLRRALHEGERVRRILRQLLDFSRPTRGVPAPVDLLAAAHETLDLVRPQRRYRDVRFEVDASRSAPLAWADPGAVTQILLNLVLNAADAALAGEAPAVVVRARPAPLETRVGEPSEPGHARRAFDAVECLVLDTGPGIAPEDRDRIFDPFFTTKPPGQGTGLGLANSLRLAEEQGGTVELVRAPPGFRTAFVLRLPAMPRPQQDAASPAGWR